MKYYKVVRGEKRGLFSCFVPRNNRFRRKYEKGKWTEARKGSLLFTFCYLKAARDFSSYSKFKIWECEIDCQKSIPFRNWFGEAFKHYKTFWDREGNSGICTPIGTVGAKRVKLIKEVA